MEEKGKKIKRNGAERINTVTGKISSIAECIMIRGEYHIKEKDCVLIDGKWVSILFEPVYQNFSTKKWKYKTANTTNGIVDFDKNGQIVLGYFEKDINTRRIDMDGNSYLVVNNEIFSKIPLIFNYKTNKLESKLNIADSIMRNRITNAYYLKKQHFNANYTYSFAREYSSEKLIPLFQNVERKDLLTRTINQNDLKEFGDFSFGLEFETSAGNIRENDCFKYGLIPLKDGSIKGHEFTSIPMQGKEGFSLLLNQIDILSKNTSFDKECSLHVHFGNFPIRKDNIFALYKLLHRIQDDIALMFPKFIFQTEKYKASQKNYCNKLERYDKFEDLYTFLSGNTRRYENSLTNKHPLDENNDHKWQVSPRYMWVNLINTCFKKVGKTVEFRIHTPTINREKIINWLFLCSAILQFSIKHKDKILSASRYEVSIDYILSDTYSSRIYKMLSSYYVQRVEYYQNMSTMFRDNFGCFDMIDDDDQTFGTNIIVEE